MTDYNSIWHTADIFCQRCHKKRQGISLKNNKMSSANITLDLCANCIEDIAEETSDFKI